MGERQRVMIAMALATNPSAGSCGRADRESRHQGPGKCWASAGNQTSVGDRPSRNPRPTGRRFADRSTNFAMGTYRSTGRARPGSLESAWAARMSTPRRMSWSDLLYLYRARLRAKSVVVQDVFAIPGSRSGVALLFASQVAKHEPHPFGPGAYRSARRQRPVSVGRRRPCGRQRTLLGDERRLPGVKVALPILEQQAKLTGPNGQPAVGRPDRHRSAVRAFRRVHTAEVQPQDSLRHKGGRAARPDRDRRWPGAPGKSSCRSARKVTPALVGATLGKRKSGAWSTARWR